MWWGAVAGEFGTGIFPKGLTTRLCCAFNEVYFWFSLMFSCLEQGLPNAFFLFGLKFMKTLVLVGKKSQDCVFANKLRLCSRK